MLKGRRSKRRRCPAYRLTNDLVVEILSRLPARSVCRFKCVSRTWRDLISHSVNRKKLAQTLAGFFTMHDDDTDTMPWSVLHFTNVSGRAPPLISPSFDFLPVHTRVFPLNSCNGLILCACDPIGDMTEFHDFVCNPTTKEWVALPDSKLGHMRRIRFLGFNPAVSPHFYVFEFFVDYERFPPLLNRVEVYSSETGERVHSEDNDVLPFDRTLSRGYRSMRMMW
ncbi:F-box protein At5g07610 [Lolium perenne]|uniref:F-box protein At5g07610 n=1 Tax=Lolium perenne TaxID=4522 RepID=UPI0021F62C31|nr:F-box protein At2g15640-like [Lolium perenne]XP_051187803.1 F-box protein At2g15640-like [Lolium perenne]